MDDDGDDDDDDNDDDDDDDDDDYDVDNDYNIYLDITRLPVEARPTNSEHIKVFVTIHNLINSHESSVKL